MPIKIQFLEEKKYLNWLCNIKKGDKVIAKNTANDEYWLAEVVGINKVTIKVKPEIKTKQTYEFWKSNGLELGMLSQPNKKQIHPFMEVA